ncbi:MAG TPA: ATP-binding protein [Bacteroidales bacterium]|nr:ATP-binding protein [Bacteroidales bacterium]
MKIQELSINSIPENLRLVEKFIEEVCDYYNITDMYFGNILISITEAAANAIIHGNKCDANKKVNITVKFVKGGLLFTVEDEGEGFDYNNIPDPTEAEEEATVGRGLFVMRSLSDKIEFLNNGRTVVMMFEIAGLEEDKIQKRIDTISKYTELEQKKQLSEKHKI